MTTLTVTTRDYVESPKTIYTIYYPKTNEEEKDSKYYCQVSFETSTGVIKSKKTKIYMTKILPTPTNGKPQFQFKTIDGKKNYAETINGKTYDTFPYVVSTSYPSDHTVTYDATGPHIYATELWSDGRTYMLAEMSRKWWDILKETRYIPVEMTRTKQEPTTRSITGVEIDQYQIHTPSGAKYEKTDNGNIYDTFPYMTMTYPVTYVAGVAYIYPVQCWSNGNNYTQTIGLYRNLIRWDKTSTNVYKNIYSFYILRDDADERTNPFADSLGNTVFPYIVSNTYYDQTWSDGITYSKPRDEAMFFSPPPGYPSY